MKSEGRPVSRAENYDQFDPSALKWDTAEHVVESLALVNEAVLSRKLTPNEGKSVAQVAAVSLKAIGLAVRAEIQELKDNYARLAEEQRGPGRRRGTS
jgi:hypothetical protein